MVSAILSCHPPHFPVPEFVPRASSSSLHERDSVGGLFSPFHLRSVFLRSLFVQRRIMVYRSIVLCWSDRQRQIELKICDLAVCKVVRLPSPFPPPQSSPSSEKSIAPYMPSMQAEIAFSSRGCNEVAISYGGQNLDILFFSLCKIRNLIFDLKE